MIKKTLGIVGGFGVLYIAAQASGIGGVVDQAINDRAMARATQTPTASAPATCGTFEKTLRIEQGYGWDHLWYLTGAAEAGVDSVDFQREVIKSNLGSKAIRSDGGLAGYNGSSNVSEQAYRLELPQYDCD